MYKDIRFFLIVLISLFVVSSCSDDDDNEIYPTVELLTSTSWAGDRVLTDSHNQVSQKKKVKIVFLTKDTGTTAIERSDAPYYDFDNVNYYMDAKAIRIAGGLLEGTYLIASFTGNKLVLKEENSYTCTITLQRQY